MSLKTIIENFKSSPLSSDPKIIKYIKIFRNFIKMWKRRINLFFLIFILTILFQIFLYDLVKNNFWYNTVVLFLTIVTFAGIFLPTYFRKDISKKDVVDTINEERKIKKENDIHERRSTIG